MAFDRIEAPEAVSGGEGRPRIAVIGSGISGLSAAWGLHHECDVTVFERNDYIGGHTNTVIFDAPEGRVPVDTGFIVFNEPNYPNLTALFDLLSVASVPAEMHFSVSARERDVEYSSNGLSGLFADARNFARPKFFAMLADIVRFYASASKIADAQDEVTVGDFLKSNRYGETFARDHILPMAAAIWSCPAETILNFPMKSLARFFINHGLVEFGEPFPWRSVLGGSASYIPPLTENFADRIHLNTAVESVRRTAQGVELRTSKGEAHTFDHVVLACHAPVALNLLADADVQEREILSAFTTQPNRAVLHTDARLMPRRRRAWASWNYLAQEGGENNLAVTYWMNELQALGTATNCFVTLNPFEEPREETVIAEFDYDHPVFDKRAITAQRDIWTIQGRGNVWHAGAWLGYGFHEDGLQSGLARNASDNWRVKAAA
jgi:predicted NAD/FAD-binding protein